MADNPLAEFVKDQFTSWKDNRKSLDAKWQTNWDHFNCVSDEVWKDGEGEGWRSNTFLPFTKQKTLSGYALVLDMLLQEATGSIPFELLTGPLGVETLGQMPVDAARPEEDAVLAMQRLMKEQLLDCQADRALMRNVMSAAIYGETYAKRFVHTVKRHSFVPVMAETVDPGTGEAVQVMAGMQSQTAERLAPAWGYVSIWDVFRDLETEDLQEGNGLIHRQMVSAHDLQKMIGQPLFDTEALRRVIANASDSDTGVTDSSNAPPSRRELTTQSRTIELLEFWGRAPKAKISGNDEIEDADKGDEVEIMAVVADGEVLRFAETEPGDRPFYRCVWDINLDGLGGMGIADAIEHLQISINGAMRCFEDNKKLSGNTMLAVKEEMLEHPEKLATLRPGMRIPLSPECTDARSAIQPVVIPDVGGGLLEAVNIYERLIDENSMIPKVSQGVNAKAQITAYEISQMVENAGKYIASVIRNFDEGLIEPILSAFLKYNMEDPDLEVPPLNLSVRPMGHATYQNKIVRVQKLMQFLQLCSSTPGMEQEYDLAAIVAEIAKAMGVDLEQFRKSDEQKQAEAEAAANDHARKLELAMAEAEVRAKNAQAMKYEADAGKAADGTALDRAKFAHGVRREVEGAAMAGAAAGAAKASPGVEDVTGAMAPPRKKAA